MADQPLQPDALTLDAARWVARRRMGLDAAGQAGLDDWLAADPRHQAAYDEMVRAFGEAPPEADPPAVQPEYPQAGKRDWIFAVLPRLMSAAGALAVAASAWLVWQWWEGRQAPQNPGVQETPAEPRGVR